jgi:hypothetical protein
MMIVGATRDLPVHEIEQFSLVLSLVSCSFAEFGKAISRKYYQKECSQCACLAIKDIVLLSLARATR